MRTCRDDGGWLLGSERAVCAQCDLGNRPAFELKGVDAVVGTFPCGSVEPVGHDLLGEGLGHGNLVDRILCERNANGVAQSVHEQAADADG